MIMNVVKMVQMVTISHIRAHTGTYNTYTNKG